MPMKTTLMAFVLTYSGGVGAHNYNCNKGIWNREARPTGDMFMFVRSP